jgi:hypothetical protein
VLIEDGPQAQLVEQGPDDQNRSPGQGLADLQLRDLGSLWFAAEETFELGEEGLEEILAAEVGDGALLDFAAVAIGFDDADVFIVGAVAGREFDDAEVHVIGVSRLCGVKSSTKIDWTE